MFIVESVADQNTSWLELEPVAHTYGLSIAELRSKVN